MRPGRVSRLAGVGSGRLRRRRRAAPEVQDRPVQAHTRPERDRLRADPRAAAGRRLHHSYPARSRLHGRQGAGGRRHPPASRGVAEHVPAGRDRTLSRALRRRRRGEDDRRAPEGLRLPVQDHGPLAPQPHDPQPHARSGRCLHGLRDRLHPGHVSRREEDPPGTPGLDGRDERQRPVSGLRRQEGHRYGRSLHLPRRRAQPLPRRFQAERVGGRSRWGADRHRGAPAPRRSPHRSSRPPPGSAHPCRPVRQQAERRLAPALPQSSAPGAGATPPTCSAPRRSTTSRPGRCPGTCR